MLPPGEVILGNSKVGEKKANLILLKPGACRKQDGKEGEVGAGGEAEEGEEGGEGEDEQGCGIVPES